MSIDRQGIRRDLVTRGYRQSRAVRWPAGLVKALADRRHAIEMLMTVRSGNSTPGRLKRIAKGAPEPFQQPLGPS